MTIACIILFFHHIYNLNEYFFISSIFKDLDSLLFHIIRGVNNIFSQSQNIKDIMNLDGFEDQLVFVRWLLMWFEALSKLRINLS